MKREIDKNEGEKVSMVILLKRIISYEKIIIPRLEIFEQIVASPPEQWFLVKIKYETYNIIVKYSFVINIF